VSSPRGRSLSGRTILVTRPRERAADLIDLLRARGATALEAPTIRLEEAPSGALALAIRSAEAGRYSWVVFTSPKTVDVWFSRVDASPGSWKIGARVAAVGDGTAEALRAGGVDTDLIPETFTTAALARSFPSGEGEVLLPRADIAPPDLEAALEAKGWTPVRVTAYRTIVPRSLPAEARRALDEGRVDAITFTSASTVDGFVRLAGVPEGPRVVCIGPVTADAAREAGLTVHAVAAPHTVEGLVAALERVVGGDEASRRPRSATR
jgi:uroporphyrinogen-III synthase